MNEEEKELRTSVNINQEQLDDYIQRLNQEFEIEFYELFSKNVNENEEEIEIKLNKEKQKLIRLVAVKNDKKFSKSKKENYKIVSDDLYKNGIFDNNDNEIANNIARKVTIPDENMQIKNKKKNNDTRF